MIQPPLSLYIHFPWCVRKCPYCDFNSHALRGEIPELQYIDALLADLDYDLTTMEKHAIEKNTIGSIFMGGGTPSLFSADAIKSLLRDIGKRVPIHPECEITLEANPGTVEQSRFENYRHAGITRLSIGCQSFQADKLQQLGRIHGPEEAEYAAKTALAAGFTNFNLDLMFGLPTQSVADALYDLQTAIALNPTHISWYQLTLEPNTLFHHQPPNLPDDEIIWTMQQQGQQLLKDNGYHQYEVSAYAKTGYRCRHNLNYWQFGDYLGIGAGAHGKITDTRQSIVTRSCKIKQPAAYLNAGSNVVLESKPIQTSALAFEFMLNGLRLVDPIPITLFCQRTGLPWEKVAAVIAKASEQGLMAVSDVSFEVTPHGRNFINDIVAMFL